MELEIIKETENSLFKRKEIQFSLDAEITPSEKEMIELISDKFSTQAENISLKGIHGKFGSKTFTINANIYDSSEEKEAVEQKKKKGAAPKEEASAETPAQAPATESPAETPVEAPAQEKTEAKQEEPKQEAEKQELAKPDEKPTQESKVDAKEE